jgi:hypothetical protein
LSAGRLALLRHSDDLFVLYVPQWGFLLKMPTPEEDELSAEQFEELHRRYAEYTPSCSRGDGFYLLRNSARLTARVFRVRYEAAGFAIAFTDSGAYFGKTRACAELDDA